MIFFKIFLIGMLIYALILFFKGPDNHPKYPPTDILGGGD